MNIQMVDLQGQYKKIKKQVNAEITKVLDTTSFINGPAVKEFQQDFETYLGVKHVIPCANGTDSLQIAMMALDLKPGDEVIVPTFTYVATAEVIALLGLVPVMTDVDPNTFNITPKIIEKYITPKTRAIVPVHLFGQSADMEGIMELANKHKLYVIEDNAQAIGSDYKFSDGTVKKTGTIGHIGSTSFFPSKNLGCYGDGGALMTNDDTLAAKMRMIANHGQPTKYIHDVVGCNSRLDSMQAAVLKVKLQYLDKYAKARQKCASAYDKAFKEVEGLMIPKRNKNSSHVFHQYTLRVKESKRDALQKHLESKGIPSMIYYPIPLYKQKAFAKYWNGKENPVTETLCAQVLSLPIHTEMDKVTQQYIIDNVLDFFKK